MNEPEACNTQCTMNDLTGRVFYDPDTDRASQLRNVAEGYDDTVSFTCSNDGATPVTESVRFVQYQDCSTALSFPSQIDDKVFEFESNPVADAKVFSHYTVFSNAEPTGCGITSCALKQKDCSTALVSNKVELVEEEGVYDLMVKEFYTDDGYSIDVCL